MAALLTELRREALHGGRDYGEFLKPGISGSLISLGLDKCYHCGSGDHLFYDDGDGKEVEVLDLVGGYGASLFGHHHPVLVARAKEMLDGGRPFVAQGSVRSLAGRLAGRLSGLVGQSTSRSYRVTLASTGAEAIEAAMKHAEMELVERIEKIMGDIVRAGRELRARNLEGAAAVDPSVLDEAARLMGCAPSRNAEELFAEVVRHNRCVLEAEPLFLALLRGFHGKSTGALMLTANSEFREPWRRIGVKARFLNPHEPQSLDEAVEAARLRYVHLETNIRGALRVEERSLVNIAACFVEPIQGEGGVQEIPVTFLRALRAKADETGFALVFDEIQCGMGRTGTFLASEPFGVVADYYALSKSLGGGLAKISALLVDQRRYVKRFGVLHTSTFADDDYASGIALGALDLLEEDGGRLMRECAEKGAYILGRLNALKQAYPDQIKEVRGRGLMIGIEFHRPERSDATFLRALSQEEMLGYFIGGYLLHEERIRVAPTLSSPETLRLQPSAYISIADLDRFCEALERLTRLLQRGDTRQLTRFLIPEEAGSSAAVRASQVEPVREPGASASSPKIETEVGEKRCKVAFLAHLLTPEDLGALDPGFADLSEAQSVALLERFRDVLGPFLLDEATVRSATGSVIDLTVFAIPFTSAQIMDSFRSGGAGWAREQVERAVELAKRAGCSVIGFGGYTSIVTNNCRDLLEADLTLTSGNSLTAAATVDSVLHTSSQLGISHTRLGLVGALGNIGAVLAEMFADRVKNIVLIGRPGATSRLSRFREALYLAAWKRGIEAPSVTGLAQIIAESKVGRRLREQLQQEGDAKRLSDNDLARILAEELVAELGGDEPVQIASQMEALQQCNIVVSATNAPHPVIFPAHLADGPVVVCDVATPGDVSRSVSDERPDITVLKGGVVNLPLGQRLNIRGLSLQHGQVYGCLGEAVLHGLAGIEESLSFGALTTGNVRRAHDLAIAHGFSFDRRVRL